ncbi:RNA-binding protein [Lacticaseibacillus nasuensis]|uniref:RNA-binding S4 domain-containing protein n=1 Tax=Lacticaseibacillus nasuensis JCM 17158 TaxID=1291734 RepID=A0A0R1JP70_9LACO|nr:YlmH/Sll1252 family protein [Lacticaseibacillus nasuensis]KRK73248.1 RNA-binding S4 domain-containing protein [Lacticaseibacillus nasuensis JCM 17158]MCX2454800.1 YlmH/Sll1252 family protein [Lacticaseibacillus nasuensis]
MNAEIYQHFRKEEASTIDALAEQLATADSEYRPVLTDFLDPRQTYIAHVLIGSQDAVIGHSFGGYPHAERRRVVFAPSYLEPQPEDYAIALLTIKYPQKFAELHHSDILGTLANLGLERGVFGDIITDGSTWQFATTQPMSDWLKTNVTKIGRISVRLEDTPLTYAVHPLSEWEPLITTVASMRLDAIVSHVFSMSRTRAKALIEAGKVRVNFATESRPDMELAAHDMVSVRGFGRIRLHHLLGTTKKERQRVNFDVLHK